MSAGIFIEYSMAITGQHYFEQLNSCLVTGYRKHCVYLKDVTIVQPKQVKERIKLNKNYN